MLINEVKWSNYTKLQNKYTIQLYYMTLFGQISMYVYLSNNIIPNILLITERTQNKKKKTFRKYSTQLLVREYFPLGSDERCSRTDCKMIGLGIDWHRHRHDIGTHAGLCMWIHYCSLSIVRRAL